MDYRVYIIQEQMNKGFRWCDETNPAASVAARHLFQQLINRHLNLNEYVRRLAALGQMKVPCFPLFKVSQFILRSNSTYTFFSNSRKISQN